MSLFNPYSNQLTLSTTPSTITNTTGTVTTIKNMMFKLQDSGATERTIYIYVKGTGVANELNKFKVNATSWGVQWENANIILQNTDTLSFKVDAGTDVNVYLSGSVVTL